MSRGPRRYSFTQINTFQTCAYQWYDRYYLYNKMPSTEAMDRGNRLHREFEDVFSGKIAMTPEVAPYRTAVDKLANGRRIITEMPLAMTKDGKICAKDYFHRYFQGAADLVLMPGPFPGPKANEDFNYSGLAYYIDWKTGKSGWEKPLQLDWMAVLIRKANPQYVQRVATRLAYTTTHTFWPQDEWRVLGPTELDEAERELFRATAEIAEAEEKWQREVPPLERSNAMAKAYFPQHQQGLCKVCSVKSCEFAKGI